jgi:hypothetical protein
MNVVIGSKWWKNGQRYLGLLLYKRSKNRKGGGSLEAGLSNLIMESESLPSYEGKGK